ncbi:rubredoxin [Aquisalimonas lutea]|uniref:rubredoxin n=1 Tax=Aquisalimonas lutea TaxID=1327750 RepID=UPI003F494C39
MAEGAFEGEEPECAGAEAPSALFMCTVCGWTYDEEDGLPEGGIRPGTAWNDIPEDFVCPECGVGKDAFDKIRT